MSDTVDIGAARVRLIVDGDDFEQQVAAGKIAIRGFSSDAQAAYDRTEKATRRASDALLDYVHALGSADSTMTKLISRASGLGVEKSLIDAAVRSWQEHNDKVEAANAAQAGYNDLLKQAVAQEKLAQAAANATAAERFKNIQDARAAQAQAAFNNQLGVSTPTVDYDRRSAQEQLFLGILEAEEAVQNQQVEVLQRELALQELIANARGQNQQVQAQQDFNKLLGIPQEEEKLALIQRRKDAEAAFLPILEEEIKLESENSQLVAKQQAFLQQLENTANTAGKTYYEMLQLRAAEVGLGEAAAPLINKIKSQNEAMGAGTLSAKQYEFALRGLPAQFTDIVVSLQGGQKPLTVLLQQGGQIKDMFGGVGNAAKVVGKEVLGIVSNPLFVLAGVAAAVAVAMAEASSRTTEFAVAAAKGNLVAGNAKGLSSLADQLSKLNNISIGNADSAVQSLAAAGKLTGDNFAIAAEASARWATITGTAADEIIGKFNELANDPMQAVLNGTLKVTEAQYAQLEAFERTGQKAKEAQLAVKLYADQINTDSASVLENLSAGAKGWIDLKNAITGAWHSFTQFAAEAAGSAFNRLKAPSLHDLASAGTGGEGMIDILNQYDSNNQTPEEAAKAATPTTAAATAAAQTALQQGTKLTTDQVNANKELQKSIDELGTKQQKFNAALVLENGLLSRASDGFLKQAGIIKDAAGAFSGPGYDKLVNGLRLKIFGQNEGGDPTLPIKEWEKTALDSLKNVGAANDELYKNHLVSIDTFYNISEGLVRGDTVIQLEAIDKQIKALQGRDNSQSKIAALNQQRNTVEAEQSVQLTKLENARADALKAQRIEYENYVESLAKANIALSRQGDQAARGVGLGDRQAALANAVDNAKYSTATNIQDIQRQIDNGQKDPAEGLKEQEAAAAALSTTLTILQGNYDSLTTAQSSWQNGATKAWQNFSDGVANVAAQTQTLVTTALDDLTSMFQDLAKTGHLSFTKLLTDIAGQIEKSGIQYLLQKEIQPLIGGSTGSSGSGSGGASALGGLGASILSFFKGNSSSPSQATAYGGDYSSAGLAAAFGTGTQSSTAASDSILKSATDWVSGIFNDSKGGASSASSSGISSIFSSVSDWVSSLFSSTESSSGSSSASGYAGLISDVGLLFSAKGNVFPAGTGLSSYSGKIVSSPTVFPFAKGGVPNVGVMGEAGSEAIMPLTRTSGGELGVKMAGAQQPSRVTNVNQTIVVPGATTRATQDQTAIKVYGAAQRAARRS